MVTFFIAVNEPPTFIEVPDTRSVVEADGVEFRCKAHGKPLPTITWLKGEDVINEGYGVTIETREKTKDLDVESILRFDQAWLSDDHEMYKIEAANEFGTVEHKFGLTGENCTLFLKR